LAARNLAEVSAAGVITPKLEMMRTLRRAETERLVRDLSRSLNATYIPTEPGVRIIGVYDRAIATPTGKIAVIRRQDTFTLAPWKPALEPMRGRAVNGLVAPIVSRGPWTGAADCRDVHKQLLARWCRASVTSSAVPRPPDCRPA
jgi:hypothetical protein